GARRMAALVDPDSKSATQLQEMVDAARLRGVELLTYRVTSTEGIMSAVDAAHAVGAAGLNAMASVMINANRQVIIDRTAVLRLPAIYQFPEGAEQGGFAAYGPRIDYIYRQVAVPVARLFRGERPQDIPVQDDVRTRNQSQDGERSRADDSGSAPDPRRQGDRVVTLFCCIAHGCLWARSGGQTIPLLRRLVGVKRKC